MSRAASPPNETASTVWWLGWFASTPALTGLIAGLLAARVLWHVLASDLTLLEDEAHYWEWSRRLDWSYYTKGPGVAWVIRLSVELFGPSEWALRLPASVAGAAGMLGAALAMRWSLPASRDRAGLATLAALLFALVPGFAAASMLMTIDAPYIACWMWGGAFALRAVMTGSRGAWIGLGAAVAVGFLFKYTILLLLPGVLLGALLTRGRRPSIDPGSLVLCAAIAACGLLPVGLWNAQHDWSTVRHLLGHLGVAGGDMPTRSADQAWTPLWLIEYLVVQIFVCGPVLALACIAWPRLGRSPEAGPRDAFIVLGAISAPVFVFYAVVALRTQAEGNWAMAGAATLTPIAAWTVVDGVRRQNRTVRFLWGSALVAGLLCLLAFPAMKPLSERPRIGGYIPHYRLSGMRAHAEAAHERLDGIRTTTGLRPFVMSDHYGRASQLAFYLPDRPVVYCASSLLGGRRTQHDLWTETDLHHPETVHELLGRPALLFGRDAEIWRPFFRSVEEIEDLPGEPKPDRRATSVGIGFLGFTTRDRQELVPGDAP
ncbi:MAG: glycosyltransferase family 39 protein [Planctomycetota bacterium]